MMTTQLLRPELGDFSSIVCFKAVIVGVEEALGEKAAAIAFLAAGRLRGKKLAKDLNLSNANLPLDQVAILLNKALGSDGTRLCLVDSILAVDETYQVFCRETVCSAGEPQGSNRNLSFTLGAVQGALEEVTQKRLRGKQIASVLRGSDHDVIEFGVL
ncbi:MAG: hypothetical protein WBA43_03990 [Elainellaceae cyanobacterium]